MKQTYKKSEPLPECTCHTCVSRPEMKTPGSQFLCTAIQKIMWDSDACGCARWQERRE